MANPFLALTFLARKWAVYIDVDRRRVSLKTDRTTAHKTAQLEGDENVPARLLDRTDDRTATLQESFCIFFMWTSTICCKLKTHRLINVETRNVWPGWHAPGGP